MLKKVMQAVAALKELPPELRLMAYKEAAPRRRRRKKRTAKKAAKKTKRAPKKVARKAVHQTTPATAKKSKKKGPLVRKVTTSDKLARAQELREKRQREAAAETGVD